MNNHNHDDAARDRLLGRITALLWVVIIALTVTFFYFASSFWITLLLAGFLIVVVYSQLLGQKALWLSVLSADVYRPVKDLVEESSELLGYLLMLFGAAEAAVAEHRD